MKRAIAAPAGVEPAELAQLADGTHGDPHRILGAHQVAGGVAVRALHPEAATAECVLEDGTAVPLSPLGHGVFAAWLEPFRALGMTTLSIRSTGSTDHFSFDELGLPGFQFIQDPAE